MFKASKLALGFLLLGALGACSGIEEPPLEHLDLGTYTIREFKLPLNDHSAMAEAQRHLGQSVTLGPDRIFFPPDFGQTDCQHEGYRLTQRPTNFIPSFELGMAGPLSAVDAGIEETQLLEIWNGCLHGAYLTMDHGRIYLPGRGALFILEKY